MAEFPVEGMALTHILVVTEMNRARSFYHDVLGAEVYREYGGTSCVLKFLDSWLLLVTGGGPTEDKPDVTFWPPRDKSAVSHSMTIRVPDCQAVYDVLKGRDQMLNAHVQNGQEQFLFACEVVIKTGFLDADGL